VVNIGARITFDGNEAGSALLDTPNAMIDKSEVAGNGAVELNNASATSGDKSGLDGTSRGRDEVTLTEDLVEDDTNDVEGGDEVGSTVTEEEADTIASLGLHGASTLEGANTTVEDDEVGILIHTLLLINVEDV